jgi:hypothetical protein
MTEEDPVNVLKKVASNGSWQLHSHHQGRQADLGSTYRTYQISSTSYVHNLFTDKVDHSVGYL